MYEYMRESGADPGLPQPIVDFARDVVGAPTATVDTELELLPHVLPWILSDTIRRQILLDHEDSSTIRIVQCAVSILVEFTVMS